MNKVAVLFTSERDAKRYDPQCDEINLVHYEGVGLIGSSTLCGHTDWVGCDFVETTKRVNCSGCKAIRDHVLGKS